ncbi:MAG: hypothetical protein ACE5JH_06715 [Acidobacteriota bacterium]
MNDRELRRWRWSRRRAAGIVVLLLLSVTLLHAAAPHLQTRPDCRVCQALSSPALAPSVAGPAPPPPEGARALSVRPDRSVLAGDLCLSLLRAPPRFAVV